MGGDRLWTLERQTGPECSQTITITRSGGPVLTSCRREDSQWKERAHRRRTSTGVDYKLLEGKVTPWDRSGLQDTEGGMSLIRGPG